MSPHIPHDLTVFQKQKVIKQFRKRVSKCIQLIQLHWEIKKSPTPANDFEWCIKADWHCKYRKSITGVKRGAIN